MNNFIITQLFMGVLSMSLTAALIGLILMAIRPLTEKNFTKKWNYYIWLLVVVRLAVPLHFEADFLHMLNFHTNIQQAPSAAYPGTMAGTSETTSTSLDSGTMTDISADSEPDAATSIPDSVTQTAGNNSILSDTKSGTSIFRNSSAFGFLTAAAYLWLFGATAALFIKLWSYYRFQTSIRKGRARITNHYIACMENAFCTKLALSACALVIVFSLSACSGIRITINDRNTPEEPQISDVPDENDSNDRSLFSEILSAFVSSDSFLSNFPAAHKYGDAWNVYDDDTLIAGKDDYCDNWGAYNYYGGQNITASGMVLYGSSTVVIAYADKDIEVDVTSSFEILEGKFKIVSIAPDGTVTTLNDTGAESRQTITMKKGRNVIKMIGQGAKLKKLALDYSDMSIQKFKNVYFSAEEEYSAQLNDKIKVGEPIDKEKVMDKKQ